MRFQRISLAEPPRTARFARRFRSTNEAPARSTLAHGSNDEARLMTGTLAEMKSSYHGRIPSRALSSFTSHACPKEVCQRRSLPGFFEVRRNFSRTRSHVKCRSLVRERVQERIGGWDYGKVVGREADQLGWSVYLCGRSGRGYQRCLTDCLDDVESASWSAIGNICGA